MLSITASNIAFTVLNLVVLYLILRHFLIGPVLGIMEQREKQIKDGLENASNVQADALDMKKHYEEKLKHANVEYEQIVGKAEKQAKAEYERILSEANAQAGKIVDNAQVTIDLEKEKALREMKSEIAGLAVNAAAKIVGAQNLDSSNQSLYDEFLEKAGDGDDTDSNQLC